jgi:hypothetical protein
MSAMVRNVYFTIGSTQTQVFAIRGVDEDQVRWLNILAGHIQESDVLHEQPEISDDLTHHGLFTYPQFRTYMGDIGYLDAISHTDTLYRHGQLATI